MAYSDKLAQDRNQIRRSIGDVHATQLFSDNEIDFYKEKFKNHSETVSYLFRIMAGDPNMVIERMKLAGGEPDFNQMVDSLLALAEAWKAK